MHTISSSESHVEIALNEDELRTLWRPADINSMLWEAIALDPHVGTRFLVYTSPEIKGFVAVADRSIVQTLRRVGPKHQVDENFIAEVAYGRAAQAAAPPAPASAH